MIAYQNIYKKLTDLFAQTKKSIFARNLYKRTNISMISFYILSTSFAAFFISVGLEFINKNTKKR